MKGILEGIIVFLVGISAAFVGLSILKIIDWLISFTVM